MILQGQGILYVNVIGVDDLLSEDVVRRTNPFVTLSLDRSDVKKTTVVRNALECEFNEIFIFNIEDLEMQKLSLSVMNYDWFGASTFVSPAEVIGSAVLPLSERLEDGKTCAMLEHDLLLQVPQSSDKFLRKHYATAKKVSRSGTTCIGLQKKDTVENRYSVVL